MTYTLAGQSGIRGLSFALEGHHVCCRVGRRSHVPFVSVTIGSVRRGRRARTVDLPEVSSRQRHSMILSFLKFPTTAKLSLARSREAR